MRIQRVYNGRHSRNLDPARQKCDAPLMAKGKIIGKVKKSRGSFAYVTKNGEVREWFPKKKRR